MAKVYFDGSASVRILIFGLSFTLININLWAKRNFIIIFVAICIFNFSVSWGSAYITFQQFNLIFIYMLAVLSLDKGLRSGDLVGIIDVLAFILILLSAFVFYSVIFDFSKISEMFQAVNSFGSKNENLVRNRYTVTSFVFNNPRILSRSILAVYILFLLFVLFAYKHIVRSRISFFYLAIITCLTLATLFLLGRRSVFFIGCFCFLIFLALEWRRFFIPIVVGAQLLLVFLIFKGGLVDNIFSTRAFSFWQELDLNQIGERVQLMADSASMHLAGVGGYGLFGTVLGAGNSGIRLYSAETGIGALAYELGIFGYVGLGLCCFFNVKNAFYYTVIRNDSFIAAGNFFGLMLLVFFAIQKSGFFYSIELLGIVWMWLIFLMKRGKYSHD